MKSSSYIEISRSAYKKNIRYLSRRIGKQVKFVSVVKGNAYGHGLETFVPMAEQTGIDYFAVFDTAEAEIVNRVKKPQTDLMITGFIDHQDLSWVIENNISFYVFNVGRLKEAIEVAQNISMPARIHIELETGLYRTGIDNENFQQVIQLLKINKSHLFLEGICTHFAGAESISNYYRIINQIQSFNNLVELLKYHGLQFQYRHCACSAAALTYPQTIMDLVRIGIAQYGFWPSQETKIHNQLSKGVEFKKDPLRQILSWKSKVMDIKNVPPGKFVSYSNSFFSSRNLIIASVPVGYTHGFNRSLSNRGKVLIRGKFAPVVGLVNMNMFLVDVTHIPFCHPGDEVVLIGTQGKRKITVSSFQEITNHLNYELLSHLPSIIPRKIIE